MAYTISVDQLSDLVIHSKIKANTVIVPTFVVNVAEPAGADPDARSGSSVTIPSGQAPVGAIITVTATAKGFGSGDAADLIITFSQPGGAPALEQNGVAVTEANEPFVVMVHSIDFEVVA